MPLHDFRERGSDVAAQLLEDKTIGLLPTPARGSFGPGAGAAARAPRRRSSSPQARCRKRLIRLLSDHRRLRPHGHDLTIKCSAAVDAANPLVAHAGSAVASRSMGRLLYSLWWAPGGLWGEPALIQDLSFQGLIHVGFDQIRKCQSRLAVFPPAVPCPVLW